MTASTNDPLSVSAPELDPAALLESLRTFWGLEGELTAVHGERDRNFRIDAPSGRHLLKVHNPADGEEVLDLQCSALRHIRTVAPDVPVPDVVPTREGHRWVALTGLDGRPSLAWVMTWLDGRHPNPQELGAAELREWGRTSARLGQALRGFVHEAASYPIAWDIRRLPQLRPWLSAVEKAQRPAVSAVLDRFEQRVTPQLLRLRAQVVHNDLAPTNVLVDDTLAVTGITDFGDMTHTALVCDLAVATADVLSGRDDGLELAHEVLSGYDSTTPLEPREVELLADLMAGRYAAAIVITAWRTRQQGSAPQIGDEAYRRLEAMLDIGLDTLTAGFTAAATGGRSSAPYVGRGVPERRRSTTELLRARSHVMGGLELSYAHPVHLVGGRGVFLEGADGRRYLDAYNNVPVLGHCAPGGRRRGLHAAGHAQHQQPLPAGGARRAGRTAAGHPPGPVRPGSAGELRQRGQRPGVADRAPCHRRLGWHRDVLGVPRRHGGDLRVLTGELGRPSAPAPHPAGRAPAGLAGGRGRSDREPRRRGPRRGRHARRRCLHQRRHPRAGSRMDRRGGRPGAGRGRPVRR